MRRIAAYLSRLFTAWVGVEEEPQEPEWSKERMAYRKTIRVDPPALQRNEHMGFRQHCGHHAYCWCEPIHACLECARLGRANPPHWSVAWFNAMSPAERRELIAAWGKAIEGRLSN